MDNVVTLKPELRAERKRGVQRKGYWYRVEWPHQSGMGRSVAYFRSLPHAQHFSNWKTSEIYKNLEK